MRACGGSRTGRCRISSRSLKMACRKILLMRVLVVEDEVRLADNLAAALREGPGFAVDCAEDGELGEQLAGQGCYDLIVLDLMLPKVDGLTVLRRLRARDNATPVLILTAKDGSASTIELLNAGADDYLSKPFDLGELLARAKALIRRGKGASHPVLAVADIEVNTLEQTCAPRRPLHRSIADGIPHPRVHGASAARHRFQARAARAFVRLQLGAPLQRDRGAHLQPAQEADGLPINRRWRHCAGAAIGLSQIRGAG